MLIRGITHWLIVLTWEIRQLEALVELLNVDFNFSVY